MSSHTSTRWPSLALAAAAALDGGPAAADIVPDEAFVSPTPVPWDRRDPEPASGAVPADGERVAVLDITSELDLFPTVARVHATVILQRAAGGPLQLGIPQFTPWVRAAPILDLEVRVNGRPVTSELVLAPQTGQRQRDDWWVWPVTFPAGKAVRIDIRYTQVLSAARTRDEAMAIYAYHVVGDAARWHGPIGAIEFTLRLHGIPIASARPPAVPTAHTPGELLWLRKDASARDGTVGVDVQLPVANLPGRDVPRAPYFPADMPAHLVLQDYLLRFTLGCTAPTAGEWERLVDELRATAGGSADPRASAWATEALHDLRRWCAHHEPDPSGYPDSSADPAVAECERWLDVAEPGSWSSPRTLATRPDCWQADAEDAATSLRAAADLPRRRRIVGWGAGAAGLALVVASGWWIHRRRRAARSA